MDNFPCVFNHSAHAIIVQENSFHVYKNIQENVQHKHTVPEDI